MANGFVGVFSHRFGSLKKGTSSVDPVQGKEAANDVTDDERIYYEPPVDMENSRKRKVGVVEAVDQTFMTEDSVYENCDVEHGFITFENATENLYEPVPEEFINDEVTDSSNAVKPVFENNGIECDKTDAGDLAGNHAQTQNVTMDKCPSYPDVVGHDNGKGLNVADVNANRGDKLSTIDSLFSKEDLDSDHLYVNGNVNNNPSNFYVTPKYSYEQEVVVTTTSDRVKKESIYDVPK